MSNEVLPCPFRRRARGMLPAIFSDPAVAMHGIAETVVSERTGSDLRCCSREASVASSLGR